MFKRKSAPLRCILFFSPSSPCHRFSQCSLSDLQVSHRCLHFFTPPQPNNLIVRIMSNYDKTIFRVNIRYFASSTFCALVAIASPRHNGATALTFLAKHGAPIPFSDEIHFLYGSSPTTLFIQVFSFPAVPADPTFNHYLGWCNGHGFMGSQTEQCCISSILLYVTLPFL